jgi:hypothetical protein
MREEEEHAEHRGREGEHDDVAARPVPVTEHAQRHDRLRVRCSITTNATSSTTAATNDAIVQRSSHPSPRGGANEAVRPAPSCRPWT